MEIIYRNKTSFKILAVYISTFNHHLKKKTVILNLESPLTSAILATSCNNFVLILRENEIDIIIIIHL